MPQIDLSILNQRQTPAFYADVLANRPAAGFIGRIFVSTDTYEFYRDNGTSWDIIGGPGSGTVTGGGSLYRVAIWNSTSSIGESNNLIFDFSTNRLGIGTNAPGAALDVHSAANSIAQFNQTTATNNSLLVLQNSGSALWRLGNYYNAGANDFGVFDVIGAQQSITIKKTTGQVLIGTTTVGSGKLVVSSATSDNGIQIAGANAPSLRIDNAESGPTKRAGLGISTAVNNFIQGSADRDFCIFNGSTAAASPILFGVYDAGATNVQEAARISAARNFLVGTTTDSGNKLSVNGTVLFSGSVSGTGNLSNFSVTAASGVARSKNITSTLIAAANNDILVGLDINPTFTNGAFTGVKNNPLRITSATNDNIAISGNTISFSRTIDGAQNTQIYKNGTSSQVGLTFSSPNGGPFYFIGSSSIAIASFFAGSGNTALGGNVDAGFKLDVIGTARVQDNLTVSKDQNAVTSINISNTTNNTFSNVALILTTNTAGGSAQIFKYASSRTAYKTINPNDFGHYNATAGNISLLNDFATGNINFTAGGSSTAQATLFSTGNFAVGTSSDVVSAVLQAVSTTKGFLPPKMTTPQKNAIATPATGLMVYDITLNKLAVFTGVNWETVTSV